MLQIIEKKDCSGCTACASICPLHCIQMQRDDEGFLYPVVNEERCIDCGACEKICPVRMKQPKHAIKEAYVVQDRRDDIRASSSSGGGYTAIAEYIISRDGTAYGAAYDENYRVHHIGVIHARELGGFRGSKYVQSELEGIYEEIKEKLQYNQWILFSGTPCQVAGLKSYLKEDWDRLITVDIACHGVPSPALWERYLDWWREYKKCDFTAVEFRSKKYGYSGSTMRLAFEDGSEYSREPLLQFYKNTMFAGLSLRPSCHDCHFKTTSRASDFTLFDCWDVNAFCSKLDDDRGTTAVLVQSEKGKAVFKNICSNWDYSSVDAEKIICNDGDMITENAKADSRRADFFKDMSVMSLPELNEKYFPLTLKKRLIQTFKPLLYRIGLLKILKRVIG